MTEAYTAYAVHIFIVESGYKRNLTIQPQTYQIHTKFILKNNTYLTISAYTIIATQTLTLI